MKIKRLPVVFHNILKMSDICKENQWQTMALAMRNLVIQNGLYTNAPAFYQIAEIEGDADHKEYTVYVPINKPVEIDDELPMEFIPELKFDDALMFRVADPDTLMEEAYFMLDACASEQGYGLVRPFYHVSYDVFGETMTDVIAPIIQLTPQDQADQANQADQTDQAAQENQTSSPVAATPQTSTPE